MEEQGTGDRQPATGYDLGRGAGSGLRRGADVAARLLVFGAGVVAVTKRLSRDVAARHVASQLVRSGTSAGANYEEARAAESRADFIHKVSVAAKEAREAGFWLRLVHRAGLTPADKRDGVELLIREANELAAILTASARTARRG